MRSRRRYQSPREWSKHTHTHAGREDQDGETRCSGKTARVLCSARRGQVKVKEAPLPHHDLHQSPLDPSREERGPIK
jgi:hypothetical protein